MIGSIQHRAFAFALASIGAISVTACIADIEDIEAATEEEELVGVAEGELRVEPSPGAISPSPGIYSPSPGAISPSPGVPSPSPGIPSPINDDF